MNGKPCVFVNFMQNKDHEPIAYKYVFDIKRRLTGSNTYKRPSKMFKDWVT